MPEAVDVVVVPDDVVGATAGIVLLVLVLQLTPLKPGLHLQTYCSLFSCCKYRRDVFIQAARLTQPD